MFGLATICWVLWRTRNSICFEDKKCRSPTEIICLASSFLSYWAGLQKPQGKLELMMGAEALKNTALSPSTLKTRAWFFFGRRELASLFLQEIVLVLFALCIPGWW